MYEAAYIAILLLLLFYFSICGLTMGKERHATFKIFPYKQRNKNSCVVVIVISMLDFLLLGFSQSS